VKSLLEKNVNLQAALCPYRDSPLRNGYSPSKLLFQRSLLSMGISTNTTIDLPRLLQAERDYRKQMSDNYNLRHRVKCTTPFAISQDVHFRAEGKKGTVVATADRGVVVSIGGSLLRWNRVFASSCAHELLREEEVQNTSLQRTPLPVPEQLFRSSIQVRSPCCQAKESPQPHS